MLALWMGHQTEWALDEKLAIDGENRIMRVHPLTTELDIRADVWSAWVRWRDVDDNKRFTLAMRFSGFDLIPNGNSGLSYFMRNGWKLEVNLATTKITGVLYSDDFDTAYYTLDSVPQYPVLVSSVVNETETPATGVTTEELTAALVGLVDIPAIAAAVEAQLAEELAKLDVPVSTRHQAGIEIPADVKKINGAAVNGTGTTQDKWRGS
ncbi:hypothetical protein N9112_00075 [bacterium]|nr:hypothetical protein [bacterium]